MFSQSCYVLWKKFRASSPYENWIFPDQDPSKHLHVRSAERIFEMAKVKAGIRKNVSIHSLRHAFARSRHKHQTHSISARSQKR
ncbi:site-specific recombinase, phage integrase domain protein [Leptospira interrogans serovar Bataviae str. L1111]|uniref:tyrosine-type recombinase/integrase n=1 Tax=Leptospira interrogans TaxID=173 RepID=UPI00029795DC|nr:tyrosine-type recombinase/integrase [Leptospira interrogans]EKR25082.1 site-specific recombinase, phage integrase domain protein [Leptospira interrogans serovar Bataviae str. L1111]